VTRRDETFTTYRLAKAAGQYGPAATLLKELGVLSGKRVERSERGEPGEFDHMSDEELREAVTESARVRFFTGGGKPSIE
jgi:hypothetical protein